jgi:hypothetical protein
VFGSTGGKENNVHEKPAAVPTYGRRTSNKDEDREPDTLPTFSSTAGHRTTNASRPSATTALLSPASARVIGEEIKDSDGRVVISLLDSDEDVEDDDDKKPAAYLGHGSCTSSGDTSASSITMSTNSLGEGMSPMATETMVSSSNTTVASARMIGEEIKADEDVEDDDDKKPAAYLGHGSCTSSGDTSASSNAVGRRTTSTSNASCTSNSNKKSTSKQTLLRKVKFSDYTMKQVLDVGDTLPTKMADIQAANWYVQGMLSLVNSSYGSIGCLKPYFYLLTPNGWTFVVQEFVFNEIEQHLDTLFVAAYKQAMMELVGFCNEPTPPHDIADDVGGDFGNDVGVDVGVDVADDVADDVGGDDGGHGNITVGERFIDCPNRPRQPKYTAWTVNFGADLLLPLNITNNAAAGLVEGHGITMFQNRGLSVNKRNETATSYGSSREITADRIAQIYINSASYFIKDYPMLVEERKRKYMIKIANQVYKIGGKIELLRWKTKVWPKLQLAMTEASGSEVEEAVVMKAVMEAMCETALKTMVQKIAATPADDVVDDDDDDDDDDDCSKYFDSKSFIINLYVFLTFVLSVDTTPRPPPPPIIDSINPDDDTIINAMKEHVGVAATKVILRHPNQDMLNLLAKGMCGDGFTGFVTKRFADITRKFSEGLSGFVMSPEGELLAYFQRVGSSKAIEGSLCKLLPCHPPNSDDIFRAGADGLPVANDNLRIRYTTEEDLAAGRLTPEFIDAMHCNPTKNQALKDACDRSKVCSRANSNQNLIQQTSAGKVTITCGQRFAHSSKNEFNEYFRTFDSFEDFRAVFNGKAADKAFHIKDYENKRKTIATDLAAARLAGTSMKFPPAKSHKTGWYPAFRITPHP